MFINIAFNDIGYCKNVKSYFHIISECLIITWKQLILERDRVHCCQSHEPVSEQISVQTICERVPNLWPKQGDGLWDWFGFQRFDHRKRSHKKVWQPSLTKIYQNQFCVDLRFANPWERWNSPLCLMWLKTHVSRSSYQYKKAK